MERRGTQFLGQFRFLNPNFRRARRATRCSPRTRWSGRRRWADGALQGEFNFQNGFTGLINYQKVSDDNYFRDLSGRLSIATQTNLPQQALAAYASPSGWWSAIANYQRFQTLQDPQNPVPVPYFREPQFLSTCCGRPAPGWTSDFAGSTSTSGTRRLVPTGQRATGYPSVAWPLVAVVRLRDAESRRLRGRLQPRDARRLSRRSKPSLVTPIASVDSGLVFERDAR